MRHNLSHLFSAFTPLAGGTPDTYYYDNEYPYDLNGSLDFTRPQTGFARFPYPLTVPAVDGLLPLFDTLQYSMMMGKTPWGAYMGPGVTYDFAVIFPNISGSGGGRLSKVSG